MKLYFLWYNSKSHKRTRFWDGGFEPAMANIQMAPGVIALVKIPKPTWSYDKVHAHIGELAEIQNAKTIAEAIGYTDLVIEPVDEYKIPIPPIMEVVH